MTARDLREALAHCDRVTRRHSSSFHLGARLFDPRRRAAATVVYAVCRAGDDAVDEAPDVATAAARLDAWWASLARTYESRPDPREPLDVALAWLLDNYHVPRSAFEELREGLASDLGPRRVATGAELLLYCRRVGGVVGLMIAPIAGYDGEDETLADAVALGQAMQLTNVLRDVGEDLRLDRVYLPADLMASYGVEEADLRAGRIGEGYIALLRDLAGRAEHLYRCGWRSVPRLHGRGSLAVGLAALNYQRILHKLEGNRWDNFTRRAHLRPLERVALLPIAAYRLARGRGGAPVLPTMGER